MVSNGLSGLCRGLVAAFYCRSNTYITRSLWLLCIYKPSEAGEVNEVNRKARGKARVPRIRASVLHCDDKIFKVILLCLNMEFTVEKLIEWREKIESEWQKKLENLYDLMFSIQNSVRRIEEQTDAVYKAHQKLKVCSRCATVNPGDANGCMHCGLILDKENQVKIGDRLKDLLKKE